MVMTKYIQLCCRRETVKEKLFFQILRYSSTCALQLYLILNNLTNLC